METVAAAFESFSIRFSGCHSLAGASQEAATESPAARLAILSSQGKVGFPRRLPTLASARTPCPPLLDVNMTRVHERYFGPCDLEDIRHATYLLALAARAMRHDSTVAQN